MEGTILYYDLTFGCDEESAGAVISRYYVMDVRFAEDGGYIIDKKLSIDVIDYFSVEGQHSIVFVGTFGDIDDDGSHYLFIRGDLLEAYCIADSQELFMVTLRSCGKDVLSEALSNF